MKEIDTNLIMSLSSKSLCQVKSSKNFPYNFRKPTFLAFMGIPGSGKSTIARKISELVDSFCYLECEENLYPNDIKVKLSKPEENQNILDIHYYFRNMRAEYHRLALENKQIDKSTIIDSFFSKLMLDILNQKNTSTDWFINSKNIHFDKIIEVSQNDAKNLADADVVIFLNVSKDVHKKFLKKRNRSSEVNENIYQSQDVFLQSTINYTKLKGKKFILIEQEDNLNKIVDKVINELTNRDIIFEKL